MTKRATGIVLLAVATLALAVIATIVRKSAPQRSACAEDLRRLCNDVRRGPGRVSRCLKRHQSELSEACQRQLQTAREYARVRHEACREDAQRFCGGMSGGARITVHCLEPHVTELSPACRAEVERQK